MKIDQHTTPLFNQLKAFATSEPISLHVPGHKHGMIFPNEARSYFASLLSIDVTEIAGMDDLHAPKGIIAEAEKMAAAFFGAEETFFLVGGSTVGNLAMILATCSSGDKIIIQRNSHKSIINGVELAGAKPVFINPEYDEQVDRFMAPSYETLSVALQNHPDAKAVVLTYPDYFGKTYNIKKQIELAHAYQIPVLVDEAHGVHFSIHDPSFPASALELGADVVVQSAHKMAPAMTMASFLHLQSDKVSREQISYFLQLLQSSSPSYPLMASLDVARSFLATISQNEIMGILESVNNVKKALQAPHWDVLTSDDPLKLTLHMKTTYSGYDIAKRFEAKGIFPELATHNQVLFIHGLGEFPNTDQLKKAVKSISDQLKINPNHATIKISELFNQVQELAIAYPKMKQLKTKRVKLHQSIGYVAAEAIIPYPPGIPLILKGEKIEATHIAVIDQLIQQGATIQHRNITEGINVFAEDASKNIDSLTQMGVLLKIDRRKVQ